MFSTQTFSVSRTFVPMDVHIGKLLRELYLSSGLKMERFAAALNHSPKSIYYHFGQEHLNTAILQTYEEGLKSLGINVDIWEMVTTRRRGYPLAEGRDKGDVEDPEEEYQVKVTASDLLRQAAALLDKERNDPAPKRDNRRTSQAD